MTEIINKLKANKYNIIYLLIFIILPIIYIRNIIDPVNHSRQLFLSIVMLIAAAAIIISKQKTDLGFMKLKLPCIIIGLTALYFISITAAINKSEGMYTISKISMFAVFYITTCYLLISGKLKINTIIKGIIIFNLILTAISIYQLTELIAGGLNFWENIENIKSTSANKNLLSSVLFLTIPFLFCAYRLNRIWKAISIATILLSICIIILLQTRAVWLAMIVSTLVVIVIYFIKKDKEDFKQFRRSREQYNFTVLNIMLVTIMCITISYLVLNKYYKKKHTYEIVQSWKKETFSLIDNMRTVEPRKQLWKESLIMMREYPIRGVGAGNWQVVFPNYGLEGYSKGTQNNKMSFQRPHNDYLWVGCETGIAGLILYLLIFVTGFYYLFNLLNSNTNTEDKLLFVFMISGIVGYLCIAIFDFPLERIEHQTIVMTILSIITFKYYQNRSEEKRKTRSNVNVLFTLSGLAILFSIIVSSFRLNGLYHTKKSYDAYYERDWEKLKEETIASENYFYNLDPASNPVEWYKGVAYSSTGDYETAKKCFERSYELHPYNIFVLNNLGSCYEIEKNHEEAIKYYTESVRIAPKFEEGMLNLSATYYNMKDYEKAYETINKLKINTTSRNYSIFLYSILIKKIESTINEWKAKQLLTTKDSLKLTGLLNNDLQLMTLYKESRMKKLDFIEYIKMTN